MTKGLPSAKVIGRIGIDVAKSKPKVVYAFIDNYGKGDPAPRVRSIPPGARSLSIIGNEVYRSDDKGATWKLVSGQDRRASIRTAAGRTHVYAQNVDRYAWVFGNIRVDPTDENIFMCWRSA